MSSLSVLAVAFALALGGGPAAAQQLIGPPLPPVPGAPEVIPGQFIVELKPGVDQDAVIGAHGLAAIFRYAIINGFAARMSDAAVARLAADPRVQTVSPDLVVHAFPKPPGSPGKGGGGDSSDGGCPDTSAAIVSPEQVPTGVSRIGANLAIATGAGVPVAILDTGVDLCHPDLAPNIKGGVNLAAKGNKPPKDGHGHGTHVAGIIGAVGANGFGVVGVAREAWLYAVKVLGDDGSGSLSTVIKGLDWAASNGMRVANLSLGALDLSLGSGPMCKAVANAVAAGVTVVAAAGNSAFEALYCTPANCPYSLTASAFVDSDGASGGSGPSFTIDGIPEHDDTFADSFSNWSDYCWDFGDDGVCGDGDSLVVDLMAPGVAILSTLPTYTVTLNDPAGYNRELNYDTLTGTSMSAPHVAGAAALYLDGHPLASPAEVRTALTTGGECPGDVGVPPFTCGSPWPDDPDFAWEPLVSAGGL